MPYRNFARELRQNAWRKWLGSGPLALLRLRGFRLPDRIFSVDASAAEQALVNMDSAEMDGME